MKLEIEALTADDLTRLGKCGGNPFTVKTFLKFLARRQQIEQEKFTVYRVDGQVKKARAEFERREDERRSPTGSKESSEPRSSPD